MCLCCSEVLAFFFMIRVRSDVAFMTIAVDRLRQIFLRFYSCVFRCDWYIFSCRFKAQKRVSANSACIFRFYSCVFRCDWYIFSCRFKSQERVSANSACIFRFYSCVFRCGWYICSCRFKSQDWVSAISACILCFSEWLNSRRPDEPSCSLRWVLPHLGCTFCILSCD